MTRTVLLLQGPPTPFWRELAQAFEDAGDRCRRVLLCPGDGVWWRGPAIRYRGTLEAWPDALGAILAREGVTDILYYGDQNPYHRAAADVARRMGCRAVAVEFGYLRPGWLTLERGGMGAWSHFPDDPSLIRHAALDLPELPETRRFAHRQAVEALHETVFVFANAVLRPLYPHYDDDRRMSALLEYGSTILRWARQAWRGAAQQRAVRALLASGKPFVLVPLQLQSDSQIRRNSPFRGLRPMLEQVLSSFARAAPDDLCVVVKIHPLDVGLVDWARVVRGIADRHGVHGRVFTIDGGDLPAMLHRCRGTVLVNSTVGLHAIRAGVPVKALGIAVYDMPGLTHQGSLDSFWRRPDPVDAALAGDVVRLLAASIQVPGSFYEPEGRRTAIAEIVRRIRSDALNEPRAFVDPPPRLAHARRLGVPV